MKSVIDILEDRITVAMASATGQADCVAIVTGATDPKFGDYQANGVMALAKKLKTNPRKLAEDVVAKLDVSDICEPPEIAGPGFINLRLKTDYLASQLLEINADTSNRLAVSKIDQPKTVVVDFSSPNIAKQMHVGHLRSTIIGDSICRLLEFQGHVVKRQNHIGDWGTHFGMLIAYLHHNEKVYQKTYDVNKTSTKSSENLSSVEQFFHNLLRQREKTGKTGGKITHITEIRKLIIFEEIYKSAKNLFDTDEEFAKKSREAVVRLQSNDEKTIQDWQEICRVSLLFCQELYKRLGVNLTQEDVRGESFYNEALPEVVQELKEKCLAEESEKAICVFPPGFKNKDGDDLPFIIQKSDGAYLYATTDLAAIRYRINQLHADKILYVTDARQRLHFEMLFAVAQMAKWAGDNIELSHVMFGSVLGEDGKPLKARSGENVKLKELLAEAVQRARAVVEQKNPDLPADKKEEIANAVGIGAIKYADYSNNRTSDYVFSFDKMLAMEGNTAPYMQYAYARIKSIERKAIDKDVDRDAELKKVENLNLTDPAEIDLAKHLIRYGEAIEAAVADYRPNYLTTYLFELAQKFSAFYTNCPVLKAAPNKRPTRLLLCDLTAKTINHGLTNLLGIQVVEQM